MALQYENNRFKGAGYGLGEPTGDAHTRLKTAMVLSGRLKSDTVNPRQLVRMAPNSMPFARQ